MPLQRHSYAILMPQKYNRLAQRPAVTYSEAFLWHLKGIVVLHKCKLPISVALKCNLMAQKYGLLLRLAVSPSTPQAFSSWACLAYPIHDASP
jgi:hypothetical protein